MGFNAFMAENVKKVEAEKSVHVSDRFEEDFKIRTLLAGENSRLRKECMKSVPVPGRKGMYRNDFDSQEYITKMIIACVTYPDLSDVKIQNSYGVMGEKELLETMLTAAEYDVLSMAVQDLNSITSMEDKIEEAKN